MGLLTGKNALVTGGGTGLGFGVAKRLLEEGANVLIVGRRQDVLEQATDELKNALPDAEIGFQVCDITQESQVEEAVKTASRGDALDILVANAGSGFPGPILQLDAEAWNYCCQLNIVGNASCIKYAGRAMRDRGGSIITISSASGAYNDLWMAPYGATKAALEHMTKTAALELASFNIRVNCISPGYIPTSGTEDHFPPELKQNCIDRTPLPEGGKPEDIGDAVVFMASDSASWVTGQVVAIDGGLALPVGSNFGELATAVYGEQAMRESGYTKS